MSDVKDKAASEAALWKQKYLDNVDVFERKQRSWQQAEEMLRKTISRLTLAADGRDKVLDKQLEKLRQAIRDRVENTVLRDHIESLSRALIRLDEQREEATAHEQPATAAQKNEDRGGVLKRLFKSEPKAAQAEQSQDAVSAEQVLLDLLDCLEVPDVLQDRAMVLREQIGAGQLSADWDSLREDFAELIASLHEQARQEQDDLEDFLSEVSERLKEVDSQLRGAADLQTQGKDNRTEMDAAVRREVEGIGSSVRDASDLTQLKGAVETRLESVLDHMSNFQTSEDARFEESQQAMAAMSERLKAMEEETQSLHEQVLLEREQAMTDALTGIPNRLAYEQRLQQEVARWKRFSTPLVLLVWDVDLFKSVNDNYGHKAGDRVLKKLAVTLHDGIRETDFAGRFGGEEFVMLMTGSKVEDCKTVADKLRKQVEGIGFHFRGKKVIVTASCGLSEFREGDTPEQLFERADKALYLAKEQGRNQCVIGK